MVHTKNRLIKEDFVLATGKTHSVREFVDLAFKELEIELEWEGEGENEIGIEKSTAKTRVEVDPSYYRPAEVDLLIGDAAKAKEILGWEATVNFEEIVKMMVRADSEKVEKRGF